MPFISSIRRKHDTQLKTDNVFEITGGDVVYTAGGYRIHMFTSVGASELQVKHLNNYQNNI